LALPSNTTLVEVVVLDDAVCKSMFLLEESYYLAACGLAADILA
jgi:hypothetical protein